MLRQVSGCGSPVSRYELWPDSVPRHSRYALSIALWALEIRGQLLEWVATTAEKCWSSEASIRGLPYSFFFWLCFGRKQGARALSRAAWSWGLEEYVMGILKPFLETESNCADAGVRHPIPSSSGPIPSSSGPRSNPSATCEKGCVSALLSYRMWDHGCCRVYTRVNWQVCTCGHPFATVEALVLRISHVASVRVNVYGVLAHGCVRDTLS